MVVDSESELELTLQGSVSQLKKLFRLRDDVRALLEEVSRREIRMAETLGISLEFFSRNLNANVVRKEDLDFPEKEGLLPLPTKFEGDVGCTNRLAPIKILFSDFHRNPNLPSLIKSKISLIEGKLRLLYEKEDFQTDTYFVLLCSFKYIMTKRQEILDFFTLGDEIQDDDESKDEQEIYEQQKTIACEVCGDLNLNPRWFCQNRVCGKCIRFFLRYVKERQDLVCQGVGQCRVDGSRLDISCKHCRMHRCVALSMVEEYNSDSRKGLLCMNCEGCENLAECQNLYGVFLCNNCKNYFQRGIIDKDYESYNCILGTKKNKCHVNWKDEETVCKFCLFENFKKLGIVGLCEEKKNNKRPSSEEMESPKSDDSSLSSFKKMKEQEENSSEERNCVVCSKVLSSQEESTLHFGELVCQVCRTFLSLSMVGSVQSDYVCESGEIGKLCTVIPNKDNTWTSKCNFCWFKTLEMRHLVERWKLCDGRTDLWEELCQDDDDDDD